jgi:hypothetical protein
LFELLLDFARNAPIVSQKMAKIAENFDHHIDPRGVYTKSDFRVVSHLRSSQSQMTKIGLIRIFVTTRKSRLVLSTDNT